MTSLTRFPEINYTTYCSIWRFVSAETGGTVGPIYRSKAGLDRGPADQQGRLTS